MAREGGISYLTAARDATNRSAQRSKLLLEDQSTVAKPELGAKRQCQSCGTKFYDLKKDPIICPKCGAIYQVVALTRAAARAQAEEEETELEKEAPETVSLEEVEETEVVAEALEADDEVEIEADDSEDDTFLEEEESDDDVSGLIDGEIESDEET